MILDSSTVFISHQELSSQLRASAVNQELSSQSRASAVNQELSSQVIQEQQ